MTIRTSEKLERNTNARRTPNASHQYHSRYSLHVATLRDRRVSIYHRTVHGAIDCLSYYFRSKTPKRQLVYKRRSLRHNYRMWRLLNDRPIFIVHIRARYIHSKRRVESTFNRKLQFYENMRTNRYRTETSKRLTIYPPK